MKDVMASPDFPAQGPNTFQGAPDYSYAVPVPAPGPQGQSNPQLQAPPPPLPLQHQQYGYGQQPGASMLPPQKPNFAAAPVPGYSVGGLNVNPQSQSFATPIPPPSQPQIPYSQVPAGRASSMANSMSITAPTAPSPSAKTTPTSEVPPLSPSPQASKLSPKDEKRVAALLHLNNVIIKELSVLQASGPEKPQSPSSTSNPAGAPPLASPSSTTTPSAGGASTTPTEPNAPATATAGTPTSATAPVARALPTKKQIADNYSRRLQVNIAYLLGMSQNKPIPSFPQAMEPPPETWIGVVESSKEEQKERWEEMREGYRKLKECWPEYRLGMRPQIPAAMNQGSNQSQMMTTTSSLSHGNQASVQGPSQAQNQQQQQQQQQQLSAKNFGNPPQPNSQIASQMQEYPQAQAQAPLSTTMTQQPQAQPHQGQI